MKVEVEDEAPIRSLDQNQTPAEAINLIRGPVLLLSRPLDHETGLLRGADPDRIRLPDRTQEDTVVLPQDLIEENSQKIIREVAQKTADRMTGLRIE